MLGMLARLHASIHLVLSVAKYYLNSMSKLQSNVTTIFLSIINIKTLYFNF